MLGQRNVRGTGAGLLLLLVVVVHLKVPLPAGELLTGISDVGWSCSWHMNSESVSQKTVVPVFLYYDQRNHNYN